MYTIYNTLVEFEMNADFEVGGAMAIAEHLVEMELLRRFACRRFGRRNRSRCRVRRWLLFVFEKARDMCLSCGHADEQDDGAHAG